MKNPFKHLGLLAISCAFVLSGCNSNTGNSGEYATTEESVVTSEETTSEETTSVDSYYSEWDYTSDEAWVDYVSQVSLPTEIYQTYSTASFLTDGYGQVDLVRKVDGDTAHFYPHGTTSTLIKGRYNCIDTPESTGVVEPWGSGASAFNGEYLANATTIVLSTDSTDSTSGPALDSTGARYLVYVWVASVDNPSPSDFTLVNLALCANGWSKAKGVSGTDFASYFEDADVQAKNYSLHVWSTLLDPDYNYDSATEGTLQMVIDSVDAEGNAYTDTDDEGNVINGWIGNKITFPAFVTATGPDTGACYLSRDFEVADSEGNVTTKRYSIYVFTSYREYAPLQTIGNEVMITGLVSEYDGILQLVGVSYSAYYPSDDDMYIVTDEDGTRHNAAWTQENNPSILEPIKDTAANLIANVQIGVIVEADLVVTGGYAIQSTTASTAWAFTLYCVDANDTDNSTQLNIHISDGIAIYKTGSTQRVQPTDDDGDGYSNDMSAFTDGVEYLNIVGALVTYTSSSGRTSYQVKLCHRSSLTFVYAE